MRDLQQKQGGPAKPLWENRIIFPENGREGRTRRPKMRGLVHSSGLQSGRTKPPKPSHLLFPSPECP